MCPRRYFFVPRRVAPFCPWFALHQFTSGLGCGPVRGSSGLLRRHSVHSHADASERLRGQGDRWCRTGRTAAAPGAAGPSWAEVSPQPHRCSPQLHRRRTGGGPVPPPMASRGVGRGHRTPCEVDFGAFTLPRGVPRGVPGGRGTPRGSHVQRGCLRCAPADLQFGFAGVGRVTRSGVKPGPPTWSHSLVMTRRKKRRSAGAQRRLGEVGVQTQISRSRRGVGEQDREQPARQSQDQHRVADRRAGRSREWSASRGCRSRSEAVARGCEKFVACEVVAVVDGERNGRGLTMDAVGRSWRGFGRDLAGRCRVGVGSGPAHRTAGLPAPQGRLRRRFAVGLRPLLDPRAPDRPGRDLGQDLRPCLAARGPRR